MRQLLKRLFKNLPAPLQSGAVADKNAMMEAATVKQMFPPGHFYSPVPAIGEIKRDAHRIFQIPERLPGINLNEAEQLEFFERFANFYSEMPFEADKKDGLRYFFENPNYGYSDAICLYAMIRHLRPQKIVEVGSGFSSCVMLDTNELFFDRAIDCTFIDPNPQLLISLIGEKDKPKIEIIRRSVQDADSDLFSALSANDILFIDSTHVSKVGSDVNNLVFNVLPRLASGVFIHFHDIFYPFEYPEQWICELGISWNEAYLLRAFLQYNDAFRIVFYNTYLEHFHEPLFAARMPLCLKNKGGSLWLRKV